jgi:flagellar biosynthesis protein FlhF
MKLSTFTAENAHDAVRIVQQHLGPDAVVVNVRQLPAQGISRLLNRHGHIEVTACVPEISAPRHSVPAGSDDYVPFQDHVEDASVPTRPEHRWRSIAWLESLGLLPEFADRLEKKLSATHGALPPTSPIAEWNLVRDTLATFWRPPNRTTENSPRPHVFIGPAGSGKTTAICKWLTSAVLRGEQSARVWRLDGETVNTSEFLTLHCELLGVPVERFWSDGGGDAVGQDLRQGSFHGRDALTMDRRDACPTADFLLVDLPGVEPHDAAGLKKLREQLQSLPAPHVHLVLNAAYDTEILFEQFHAFASFLPEDLIFTHLDEEHRRVKLWNFVLGTNCRMAWLAGGQKLPGEFKAAESSLLFPHKKTR